MSIIWQIVSLSVLKMTSINSAVRNKYFPLSLFTAFFCHQLTQTMSDYLTSLVGGDGHRHSLFWPGALRRDSVHRPHLKGVVGVGLQLIDGHPGSLQAQLLGAEVDAVTTGLTTPAIGPAALTHHIVCQVLASS